MISDDALRSYNKRGLVPGPHESEEQFLNRALYCLELEEGHIAPLMQEHRLGKQDREHYASQAYSLTKKIFDISPDWVPVFFSNRQLPPWHGGCAWIFQENDTTPLSAVLQLRKAFGRSATYLGIYKREELMAHEFVHVGRMAFDEPIFEEILAYRTSRSSFRRWLGPIVQSAWESLLFLLVIGCLIVLDGTLLFTGHIEAYREAMWLKMIPAILVTYALYRLWKKHKIYDTCLKKLQSLVGKAKSEPVIYRLTDQEIKAFASASSEEIMGYVKDCQSLRWHLLKLIYFY